MTTQRKWRVENWDYARWTPPARPTQFRVRWEDKPWGVMRGIGFPTAVFPTWQAAMAYVNQQIRAEQRQQAARARFIEVRPGATPSATDVRVVFRCPACMSEEAK